MTVQSSSIPFVSLCETCGIGLRTTARTTRIFLRACFLNKWIETDNRENYQTMNAVTFSRSLCMCVGVCDMQQMLMFLYYICAYYFVSECEEFVISFWTWRQPVFNRVFIRASSFE